MVGGTDWIAGCHERSHGLRISFLRLTHVRLLRFADVILPDCDASDCGGDFVSRIAGGRIAGRAD